MEIRRDLYLDKLIRKKHNGLIKVITGVRRCGKSYLLNTLFYRHLLESGTDADHIIRFAFDSADDLFLIEENLIQIQKEKRGVDPEKFTKYIQSKMTDDGMYYLLLDEIQMLDCFEAVLNGYLRKQNTDVFVTGSNAKLLSKEIATEFAGRGDEIPMYPLSFSEFMSVYPNDRYMGLTEYMLYGGIPQVVLQEEPADKALLLQSLFNEIYIRDITKRNRIRNTSELDDLLNILSSAIGSLTNPEKLKNTFRTLKSSSITSVTIKKYLEYLEDCFLIEPAQRYDIKGKAYMDTPQKYYFSDLGLRNARIHFRQFEKTHAMENVIYNELRMRGYNVDVGVIPVVERNEEGIPVRKQLEIDFVCNLGFKRLYIQSAYSIPDEAKRTQEIRPFRKIDDSFRKIIITGDMTPSYYDDYGVLTVNIYDFLLDPKSIEK
ncbi:MAG: ATP-binding protein [Erysipelotrichaceae bacterium]|nr:ATP-binding protein [Erysipelotrichaceae bacterium]